MTAEIVLAVEGVSKSFGALAALEGVSFDVRAGEVFSVIGPNGAGKSTLFNVIAGLHVPTSGRIVFGGGEITGLAPEVINRRGLAKTFQITNIFPGISVYDNVRVAAESRVPVSGRLPSWTCWAPSASPPGGTSWRRTSRTASSAISRSASPSPRSRRCCSWTSRRRA
jgi:branched-chain amino acid transport system ATP-binding protein